MTRRTRRGLFYGLCAVFLLGGSGVIFYALGWRIDIPTLQAQKVGAIYVRSFPSSASITLNGIPTRNKSGLIDRGTFIGSLFPKNYLLQLSAEGYQEWKQHVIVAPTAVSELKYAVLVPEKAEKVLTGGVSDFQIVNGGLLVENPSGRLFWKDQALSGTRAIAWTTDTRYLITRDGKTGPYFLNDLSGSTSSRKLSFAATNIIQDPAAGNMFLVQSGASVFTFDPSSDKTLVNRIATTTGMFAASPSRLAWTRFDPLKNTSHVIFYDRFSKLSADTAQISGRTARLEFRNDDALELLQDDGSLYSLKADADQAEKVADRVKDFFVSEEKHFIAALEPESIEVFSTEGEKNYWRFRLPENASIGRLAWYPDEMHLFVFYPNRVAFLDLNDKSLENFLEVAATENAGYDPDSNIFYFLKNSYVWKLEFPK